MTDRKKWGIAAIVTGVVFVAVGIVVLATTTTPAWVAISLVVVDAVLSAIGIALLAKPVPPA
jgi:hypothetical protein